MMPKSTLSAIFSATVMALTVAFLPPVVAFAPASSIGSGRVLVPSTLTTRTTHSQLRHYHDIQSQSSTLFASESISLSDEGSDETNGEQGSKTIIGKFVDMLKPQKSEKLSTKEFLKKIGLSAFLSYGFISNVTSVFITSLSWFTFSKKSGISPLAPGQWRGFLAVYAGFYVFSNLTRSLRIGLAVGISKYFDIALNKIQEKLSCPRPVAIGILVFLANIVATVSLMVLGVSLASFFSGVPIFPPKV